MGKCPNCQSEQLKRRGARLIRNIKLRKIDSSHDPWVCRSCGWTGTDDEVTGDAYEEPEYEHAEPSNW